MLRIAVTGCDPPGVPRKSTLKKWADASLRFFYLLILASAPAFTPRVKAISGLL
jgi:hypothetical protein